MHFIKVKNRFRIGNVLIIIYIYIYMLDPILKHPPFGPGTPQFNSSTWYPRSNRSFLTEFSRLKRHTLFFMHDACNGSIRIVAVIRCCFSLGAAVEFHQTLQCSCLRVQRRRRCEYASRNGSCPYKRLVTRLPPLHSG